MEVSQKLTKQREAIRVSRKLYFKEIRQTDGQDLEIKRSSRETMSKLCDNFVLKRAFLVRLSRLLCFLAVHVFFIVYSWTGNNSRHEKGVLRTARHCATVGGYLVKVGYRGDTNTVRHSDVERNRLWARVHGTCARVQATSDLSILSPNDGRHGKYRI